jgi:predicted Zn finger-like uncharacterized protein
MIVECPSCQARFNVPDSQIPAAGRVVRCSRCKHEWHIDRAQAAPVQPVPVPVPVPVPQPVLVEDSFPLVDDIHKMETVQDAPEAPHHEIDDDFLSKLNEVIAQAEGNKPNKPHKLRKQQNSKWFKIALPSIALVWFALALVTYYPSWHDMPGLSGIYSMLGSKPVDGLVFADVTMEREQNGPKAKFILSGSIRNQSSEDRVVPTVRVDLRNKDNKSVWGREYPVNAPLKAGEVYPFRITNVETSFASSVSTIVVDMGNSIQLMVR